MIEPENASAGATPVSATERIPYLDILRGAALLGILLMNVQLFSQPTAWDRFPYLGPGGGAPLNTWIWAIVFVVFDGKMRGIFSIMFGAGIYLLIHRSERRGSTEGADIHFRRTLWLMLFGMIHAYAIWWGDILFPYALMGLLVYPFRKMSVRGLLIIVCVQFLIMTVGIGFQSHELNEQRDKAAAIEKKVERKEKLSKEDEEAKKAWDERKKNLFPNQEEIDKELKDHRAGYLEVRKKEAKLVGEMHGMPIYSPFQWDVLAMVFLGMALIRTGVLTGERSKGFYWKMLLWGYGVGLPLAALMTYQNYASRYDPFVSTAWAWPYELERVGVTLGHIALGMLIAKSGWFSLKALTAVGRMAFSNYILTSLLCTTVFYGYGVGLYGKLQRWEIYLFVLSVWCFNLTWSRYWLSKYRFGPLEWCWRSLTYWKKQPMRLVAIDKTVAAVEDANTDDRPIAAA